jgi:hypothetical protein
MRMKKKTIHYQLGWKVEIKKKSQTFIKRVNEKNHKNKD